MRSVAVIAFVTAGLAVLPDASNAQSDVLQRLEAKLDAQAKELGALAKENAALRARVKKLETLGRATATTRSDGTQSAAVAAAPNVDHAALAARAAYIGKAPVGSSAVSRCGQFGGYYAGAHAGWTYYKNHWADQDNLGFNFTFADNIGAGTLTENGWNAGVQGGYNWQMGCVVFGVQGDWSWSDSEARASFSDGPPLAGTMNASSRLEWFGTVRTRTGLVVDNLLLYVTGGFAFGQFDRNFTYVSPIGGGTHAPSFDDTRLGLVVGAGTEWRLDPNWSVTGEVLYLGFEKDNKTFNCAPAASCPGGVAFPYRFEFSDSVWVGRLGANYRWGVQ